MNKLLVRCIFAISIFVFTLGSNVYAGSLNNWELALEYDGNGAVLQGSYNSLQAAIENGASVKVVVSHNNIFQAFLVSSLNVMVDQQLIFGFYTYHIQYPNSSHLKSIVFATDGRYETTAHNLLGDSISKIVTPINSTKWFISR